jgi:hypothetical protein
MRALLAGSEAKLRRATGPKSQGFESTIRGPKGISGARYSNDFAVAPAIRTGMGCSSSLAMAAATLPMAVCGGGMEEWPPSLSALSSTLR